MSGTLDPNSASGSATGNPRNKVALKPGFSLIGWIRYTNSGVDLTGFGGKIVPVSYQELAKHNKIDDCWTAVRGRVYNITKYLDFHPGGVDQLMRGAGIDATNLFDEYHAWVNIDQLLAKCFIGPLKNTVILNLNLEKNNVSNDTVKLSPPAPGNAAISKTIPRFDWIQKKTDLSIYFYTKSFSNPGIIIERISDREYNVTLYVENTTHAYKFDFLKALMWKPDIKINLETGKIEISFLKEEEELWSSFGIFEKLQHAELKYTKYTIASKQPINHDSFLLVLRPKNDQIINLAIGYHVNLRQHINILDKNIVRSYTPIPMNFCPKIEQRDENDLHFIIKRYETGTLSKYIFDKDLNEILVSEQKGSFNLGTLKNDINIGLLGAGSGITPFLSIINHLLERNISKIENIYLYYFNKTEQDIWLKEQFSSLSQDDKRLKVKHILSEADENWKGASGRIGKQHIDEMKNLNVTHILVCGNSGFNDAALKILSVYGFDVHCFQG